MRNNTPSGHPTPATNNSYRPAVPISVYRELAAELQATQAMLDSLNGQNQQLTRQNQQLRQEVEKAVQSALQMQEVLNSMPQVGFRGATYTYPEVRTEPSPAPNLRRPRPSAVVPQVEVPPPPQVEPPASVFPEQLYTEQEESPARRPTQPESASEVSGLWLVVAIFVIVVTAFGLGFLVVRPILNGR